MEEILVLFPAILFVKFPMCFSDNASYVVLANNLMLLIKVQNIGNDINQLRLITCFHDIG